MYSITLQTTDNIVTSGERVGQIQFAASNESDGSAAISVAGSVYCQAEGSFQSASNPTSLVLATAAADASAAVGRIKVTDNGNILPMSNNSYDLGNSNLQFKNQYISEGVVLSSNTPSSTTNKLYNEGGTLKFNGSAVGGGSSYTAGSGLTLVGTEFNTAGSGNFEEISFPQAVLIGKDVQANGSLFTGEENLNVSIGYQSGSGAINTRAVTALGHKSNALGIGNGYSVFVGDQSANNSQDHQFSVAVGRSSLASASGCDRSVFIGTNAGQYATTLNDSVALGYQSADYANGNYNIAIGKNSLLFATGDSNIEIVTNGSIPSLVGANDNKLHIENTIVGDTSSKLLAIGNVGSSDLTPDATLEIKPNATTDVGLIVQAAASHSASLQEWQNSSETKLLAVGPDGGLEIPSNTPSTTTNKLYNDGSNLRFGTDVIIDSTNVNTGLQWQPLGGGLNVTGLTTTEFSAATLVTEADSISSNDNDTTIPTSAAVKDYVDNNAGGGISNVVEDTTPQLGGDLDTNHKKLSFPGNIILDSTFVEGFVSASGSVHIGERAAINSATDMFSDVMIGKGAGANSDRYEQTGFLTFNYSNNVYIGRHAGSGSQQGYAINIGDGAGAGTDMVASNVNGLVGNIAIGQNACRNESRNGSYYGGNVAVGTSALDTAYNTESAVALGYFALYDAKFCGYSVAVGRGSLQEARSAGSVAVGRRALYSASGDYNTGLGYYAGNNLHGSNNIEIRAGSSQDNSILNGYDDKITIRGNSNSVFVGDLSSRLFAIGDVGVADITPDATLEVKPASATDTGLIVQAAASQTATLQEWQNSSETKLLAVGPDGGLEIPSNVPSTTTNKLYNDGGTLTFNGSAVGGGGGTPGGSDTQIQFNDGGSFGGDADLVWNKTTNALTITGSLNATTKSFLIDHPSKPGMKLQYASLEGPENGVYVRGTTDKSFITLPDYWRDLVHDDSITVTVTPVGQFQPLFVEDKNSREIRVGGVCGHYDYVVWGERKDVDKLEVEW